MSTYLANMFVKLIESAVPKEIVEKAKKREPCGRECEALKAIVSTIEDTLRIMGAPSTVSNISYLFYVLAYVADTGNEEGKKRLRERLYQLQYELEDILGVMVE